MDELARILLQKEGEPTKDSVVQTRPQAGGKRAIGKAVAKGGLLIRGKNPGNVNPFTSFHGLRMTTLYPYCRFNVRKMIFVLVYKCHRKPTTSRCKKRKR
jgi:hypothetical protein